MRLILYCIILGIYIVNPYTIYAKAPLDEKLDFQDEMQMLGATMACMDYVNIKLPPDDWEKFVTFNIEQCSKTAQQYIADEIDRTKNSYPNYFDNLTMIGISRMTTSPGAPKDVCINTILGTYKNFKKAGINASYMLKAVDLLRKK